MPETITIPTTFNVSDLPAWAQRSFAVRWLAKRSLEFRCDVFRAEMPHYQQQLRRQAERRREEWENA